ncbi:MBL fold metallo-hydrolase [Candidatus Thiosymbion oneisti]|uniref:MBL fold metallo-hydrolase n=1 Tax=Candidatus Thiosymbion oneisti TaxID=589554 RepID=UPI000A4E6B28|nr:MBL fold metallo-hydrolase [Candidatus Thiosymbion oneisti]
MNESHYEEVAAGIYCIETGLYRPGLAACYLIRAGDRLAFVETGTARSVPRMLALVSALGLTPEAVDYVIPTHVHLDHAGGAGDLMARCPKARLVVHPKGADHMLDPSKLVAGATAVYGAEEFARHFDTLTPIPAERVMVAEDSLVIDLNGRPLTFIDTPGHANHHGCIFDEHTRGWFTGDTFGIAYPELHTPDGPFLFAPTTPVAFDPAAWQKSLDRLMGYNPKAVYLTHYGRLDDPQALEEELRRSIRDFTELALAEEGNEQAGRSERLRAGVAEQLLGRTRRQGCALDESRIRAVLEVDIALNAQGLEVWLARRAKQAAEKANA